MGIDECIKQNEIINNKYINILLAYYEAILLYCSKNEKYRKYQTKSFKNW